MNSVYLIKMIYPQHMLMPTADLAASLNAEHAKLLAKNYAKDVELDNFQEANEDYPFGFYYETLEGSMKIYIKEVKLNFDPSFQYSGMINAYQKRVHK